MKRIQSLFAGAARLLKVQVDIEHEPLNASQRKALLANFGAIVRNGLFFPTAGKILGAGLLLAWFLDELKSPLLLIGLLVMRRRHIFDWTVYRIQTTVDAPSTGLKKVTYHQPHQGQPRNEVHIKLTPQLVGFLRDHVFGIKS